MRTIKFRAWDGETMWEVREIEWNAGGIASMYLGLHSQKMIDTVKLMQFTGLLDKNGKDIYEGDILERYGVAEPIAVYWMAPAFVAKGASGIGSWYFDNAEEVQIIGNIYENPDLDLLDSNRLSV